MKNLYEIALSIGVEGFLHCNELQKLVELAAGRDVLEIGSFKGLSAWGMSIAANSVLCVDTFRADSAGQTQKGHLTTLDDFEKAIRGRPNVNHIVGSSSEVTINSTFDMIFLDANHTYEDVLADIKKWWPQVRYGGVFVLHDYRHHHFPGVEKAADEYFGPAPEGTTLVTLRWVEKPRPYA